MMLSASLIVGGVYTACTQHCCILCFSGLPTEITTNRLYNFNHYTIGPHLNT
uniref:Uncharacterized protein n=1 Tax=Anguilla anguilla TaxID=7936 RepID=A0A0E9TUR1_ANGAN